ncbi:MAG: hypothetical protein OEW89_02240 [Gammaproteobacteria bacterium]|nr:hypothetical protein [Gammaproteobacteria bacterium]MDH5594707.1 hypothetical protein [Gammaproteobacteria bacterium]
MPLFSKSKTVESTAFSEFIRNASSREKKRVYSAVLKKATERQFSVIRKVGKTGKTGSENNYS